MPDGSLMRHLLTPDQVFGELRSSLHQPPTAASWASLCEVLDRVEEPWLGQVVLPYLARHVERWPDERRVVPSRWIVGMLSGRAMPQVALARHLEFNAPALWHEAACAALARHGALRAVRRVSIRGVARVSWRGAQRLLASPHLAQLEHLELAQLPAQQDALTDLVGQLSAVALRGLTLRQVTISSSALSALLESPWASSLRSLHLSDVALLDQGARALARAPLGASLHTLSLERVGLSAQGAAWLARSPWMAGVSALSVSHNHLYHAGVLVLLEACAHGRLARIDLSACRAGLHSLGPLREGAPWGALRALSLGAEPGFALGARLARRLALCEGVAGLESLALGHHELGDEGLGGLMAAPWFDGLRELDLRHNRLRAESARALIARSEGLRRLDLRHNLISPSERALIHALAPGRQLVAEHEQEHQRDEADVPASPHALMERHDKRQDKHQDKHQDKRHEERHEERARARSPWRSMADAAIL